MTNEERRLSLAPRVFLCHSEDDKSIVRSLCDRLVSDGIRPWLDERCILPGQDWELEVSRALRGCDVILVCLSETSVAKPGYIQKEIRNVLSIADEKPEGAIFVIPARLNHCRVPDRLRKWQWVDLFDGAGYARLLSALSSVCSRNAGVLDGPLEFVRTLVTDICGIQGRTIPKNTLHSAEHLVRFFFALKDVYRTVSRFADYMEKALVNRNVTSAKSAADQLTNLAPLFRDLNKYYLAALTHIDANDAPELGPKLHRIFGMDLLLVLEWETALNGLVVEVSAKNRDDMELCARVFEEGTFTMPRQTEGKQVLWGWGQGTIRRLGWVDLQRELGRSKDAITGLSEVIGEYARFLGANLQMLDLLTVPSGSDMDEGHGCPYIMDRTESSD